MASSVVQGDIYVENDFDNIFIVNPNKVYNNIGGVEDRNVKQEDLVMYANLECAIQPRSRLLIGDDGDSSYEIVAASKLNFLKPNNQDYLGTNWTQSQTSNSENVSTTELLGIVNITYNVNPSFTSTVTIVLEDVRGRALFELGDKSPYSLFFNLPYPTFYLTLKGFYGKAIRVPLFLQKFNANMNQDSGNFTINLTFLTYQFTVLQDLTQSDIFAVGKMYLKQTSSDAGAESATPNQATPSGNVAASTSVTYKGKEYINNVYKEYKDLGLVDKDLPQITVPELVTRLDNFVSDTLLDFGEENVKPLNDCDLYADTLVRYRKDVVTAKGTSFFEVFVDKKNFWVIEDPISKKNIKIYTLKQEYINTPNEPFSKLKQLILRYNIELAANATLGSNGIYSIKKIPAVQNLVKFPNNDIQESDLINKLNDTYKLREGKQTPPTDTVIQGYKQAITLLFQQYQFIVQQSQQNGSDVPPLFFYYEGDEGFSKILDEIQKRFNKVKQNIEDETTKKLSDLLASNKGIGFKPTIRNIIGILLASSEAFLRLMSEVHNVAFDNRDDENRRLGAQFDINTSQPNPPVFPWPQVMVETSTDNGTKFEIAYPGDLKFSSQWNGNDSSVWPEVEFVEEYLVGFFQRTLPTGVPEPSEGGINKVLFSGFDTVPSNTPYSNLEENSFLYEFYDRTFAFCRFQGFNRSDYGNILDVLTEAEYYNILTSVVLSQSLTEIYKNNSFPNLVEYIKYLSSVSNNGIGKNYQELIRGIVTNEYLKNKLDSGLEILQSDLPPINIQLTGEEKIEQFLKNPTHNQFYFTDTYPFTDIEWCKNNLEKGQSLTDYGQFNDTTKSLIYNDKTKKISNYSTSNTYGDLGDKNFNRPILDFDILTNTINCPVDIGTFYVGRKKFMLTEGIVNYDSANIVTLTSVGTTTTTTSMLNTNFFVGILNEEIVSSKQIKASPVFISSAFLFLQSLPYPSLKGKFKTKQSLSNNLSTNSLAQSQNPILNGDELNYIAATFKKFGSIHSLPELFVLKIGAIWYRYTTYVNTGIDIIAETNDSTLFRNSTYNDIKYLFDPIDSDESKIYTFILKDSNENDYTETISLKQTYDVEGITLNYRALGFYPEIINNFYYFINGVNVYEDDGQPDYVQRGIQSKIDTGDIVLISAPDSNIYIQNYLNTGEILNIKTWSVLIKNNNNNLGEYVTCPSFGSTVNESKNWYENAGVDIFNSEGAVFGSLRTFWGQPNFGFINSNFTVPKYNQYLSFSGTTFEEPFGLVPQQGGGDKNYSNIEELFSLFTYEDLEAFSTKFLSFCKPKLSSGSELNFHKILSNTLSYKYEITGSSINNIVQNIQNKSNELLINNLSTVINKNTILKISNPTRYDVQAFNYFTKIGTSGQTLFLSTLPEIETYQSVTPGLLPYDGLQNNYSALSTNEYIDDYKELLLRVGNSTASGFTLSTQGSYVFDFFVDNNIAFTKDNIRIFQNVIKIYATQKSLGLVTDSKSFNEVVRNYILELNNFENQYFINTLQKLRAKLPNPAKQVDSKTIDGDVVKIESYDRFKAINDKWVAGTNYKKNLIFKDIMFNDRANREVGDKILVNVSEVKDLIVANPNATVESIVKSILVKNNFIVMNIPSYVNFYGVASPTESDTPDSKFTGTEFSNALFGSYSEVDYTKSKNKLVCLYGQSTSQYLENSDINRGFNNDTWNLGIPTNNPAVENLSNKKNWGLTNKVVGVAVDFGLQNQSVFTNISLSQDLGKATSESLKMEYDLAQQKSGTRTSTQSSSLFNIYKTRAYQVNIECMGNAMIQPTMYFIIRNVPMFSGPYWIQSVSHVITNGSFTTSFSGTRQRIAEYPIDDLYLQSVKKQFLSQIKNNKRKQNVEQNQAMTVGQANSEVVNTLSSYKQPSQTGDCKVDEKYARYEAVEPVETKTTFYDLGQSLANAGISGVMRKCLLSLFIIESEPNDTILKSYNFNFAGIPLNRNWGPAAVNFMDKKICLSENNVSTSYASFEDIDKHISFLNTKYKLQFELGVTDIIDKTKYSESFAKVYIENFPYNKKSTMPNVFEQFKSGNDGAYQNLLSKIQSSFDLALKLEI